jgi:hypothetical protein
MAVEEPTFLHAVQRDVGVVEIEDDLAWRTLMRLEEKSTSSASTCAWSQSILWYFAPSRFGMCSTRLSVLLPAKASQSERSTGASFPASTVNVGSLRNSSWSLEHGLFRLTRPPLTVR